ncbi:cation:proton antiporter [Cognatiyoonia sp. IB215182]|uniref:cation:proton antiporter n=1 Tax=Cognatiyoonia sp. IB215182 TaxID=3097353 RepID=UPI002A102EB5|nr:cation:proton antiporter [Cognatiyoonia sp. IB215182]MDX8354946.1 cation:proton antiporter [Cognatiyoonia sp. IB215182]
MQPISLIALGALFLGGLVADLVSRRTGLPRVTLLLLIGLAAGASGFDIIPIELQGWYDGLSVIALTMVAFLLGSALHRDDLRQHGRAILALSLAIVLGTLVLVSAGLAALGVPVGLALILAAIATATAPAATTDAIDQSGIENGFTQTVRGIVAIDDVWGLLGFSLILVIAAQLNGQDNPSDLAHAFWEVGGAIALGLVIGGPAALLTGRLRDGEPLQIEALSLVFLSAGMSMWLEVSFLITGMVVGAVIVNLASHHRRAFHEIAHIRWPFIVLFFILAGSALEVGAAMTLGFIGLAFVVLRSLARILGSVIGGRLVGLPMTEGVWYGIALLPQAGVAIGMALIAAQRFPLWANEIIALTIGTTVVFEILGPAATLLAVRRMQDRP